MPGLLTRAAGITAVAGLAVAGLLTTCRGTSDSTGANTATNPGHSATATPSRKKAIPPPTSTSTSRPPGNWLIVSGNWQPNGLEAVTQVIWNGTPKPQELKAGSPHGKTYVYDNVSVVSYTVMVITGQAGVRVTCQLYRQGPGDKFSRPVGVMVQTNSSDGRHVAACTYDPKLNG